MQIEQVNNSKEAVATGDIKEIFSVAEALEQVIYDQETVIYGKVSLLAELSCPCLALTSAKKTITVWYDLMVEDNRQARPGLNVTGINNGDDIVVVGEFKSAGG